MIHAIYEIFHLMARKHFATSRQKAANLQKIARSLEQMQNPLNPTLEIFRYLSYHHLSFGFADNNSIEEVVGIQASQQKQALVQGSLVSGGLSRGLHCHHHHGRGHPLCQIQKLQIQR